MSIKKALTEFRTVKVTFDDGTAAQLVAPIDSYKAALALVEKMEGQYSKLGAAGVPDLTAKAVLATGGKPFQVHSFTVTTVMATGSYQFVYVETKPFV